LEGDYDYGRLHKILTGWRGEIPFYSVVHGGAIHLIDLLLWLTDKTIDHVFAWGNNIATADTSFRHLDCVAALLKFTDGTLAKVTANFASVTPHHHKVCVYGTAGSFIQSHPGATYLMSRDPNQAPSPVTDTYPGTAKGGYAASLCALSSGWHSAGSQYCRGARNDGGVLSDRSISEHQGQPESVDYGWTISAQIFIS
jgi:predicted dehydrogenase